MRSRILSPETGSELLDRSLRHRIDDDREQLLLPTNHREPGRPIALPLPTISQLNLGSTAVGPPFTTSLPNRFRRQIASISRSLALERARF